MQKLWEHQEQAIQRSALLHNYALFFEQGTGKTRTALEIMRTKFNAEGRVMRTLIFTLPLPIPQWREEWLKFTKINKKLVIPLQGAGKKRLQTFLEGSSDGEGKIFITNWEALLMDPLFQAFKQWQPEIVLFDESHKAKSPTARRAKLAYELANPYDKKIRFINKPHTYLLTGTPYLSSPMDLFQQFKILDGGETFGSNFFAFRARFFRDRNAAMPKDRYFPNWQIMSIEKDGFDGLKALQDLIQPVSMRVLKEDCLDLPPELIVPVKVGMTKEQERLYKEMKTELVTYFKSKACVASMALTKALRLMQIASGFISVVSPGEDEEKQVILPLENTPKLDALKELLTEFKEQNQKVIIWAVFKYNYKQISDLCASLGLKCVEIHGGISEKQKLQNIEDFKNDPDTKVLLGHPLSGGVGLNLTCARYSIFYSRNFSLEQWLQARARNHRGGSKEAGHVNVTHYNLICENTIEELVVEKLNNKEDMSEKLLGELISTLEG